MIPSLAQRRRPLLMTMTGRLALYARRHRRSRLLGYSANAPSNSIIWKPAR